jgi:hypothetical protein
LAVGQPSEPFTRPGYGYVARPAPIIFSSRTGRGSPPYNHAVSYSVARQFVSPVSKRADEFLPAGPRVSHAFFDKFPRDHMSTIAVSISNSSSGIQPQANGAKWSIIDLLWSGIVREGHEREICYVHPRFCVHFRHRTSCPELTGWR